MSATLQFLGAARSVTGSKFLLEVAGRRVLVECGLFQGKKKLRSRNWRPLPVDPASIETVVLTHGHVDHSAYLPRLVRDGFRGQVHCTPATVDIARLILPDSARLQEEHARYANKKGFSKHHPALPLYTEEDAEKALERLRPLSYRTEREIAKGVTLRLHPSGHILGAAFAELTFEDHRLVISGDLGSYDGIVMKEPAPLPADVDSLLVECTYGGRSHDTRPVQDQIAEEIGPVLERGGVVIIPAFAVGRTTLVLYHLRRLMEDGRVPDVPIYIDSPMATDAVEIYCEHGDEHNLRVDLLADPTLCPIRPPHTVLVRHWRESKALNERKGPMVIISASGMATGGRVLHHLVHRLPHAENLVLLVGYQAGGTRGRRLQEGEESVRIYGEWIPVKAQVAMIRGLSAHGDGDDVLRWLGTCNRPPGTTYLVHGEPEGLERMQDRIAAELGFPTATPDYEDVVTLGAGTTAS